MSVDISILSDILPAIIDLSSISPFGIFIAVIKYELDLTVIGVEL